MKSIKEIMDEATVEIQPDGSLVMYWPRALSPEEVLAVYEASDGCIK